MNRQWAYEKKPLSVDELINENGNWMVVYVYCNWGPDPKGKPKIKNDRGSIYG